MCHQYAGNDPDLVQFDAAAVHYEVVDVCPKEPMT